MSELKQKSLTEIGMFIPLTYDEFNRLWPREAPLTHEIYERAISLMQSHGIDLLGAYQIMQEEDSQPDHPWS